MICLVTNPMLRNWNCLGCWKLGEFWLALINNGSLIRISTIYMWHLLSSSFECINISYVVWFLRQLGEIPYFFYLVYVIEVKLMKQWYDNPSPVWCILMKLHLCNNKSKIGCLIVLKLCFPFGDEFFMHKIELMTS